MITRSLLQQRTVPTSTLRRRATRRLVATAATAFATLAALAQTAPSNEPAKKETEPTYQLQNFVVTGTRASLESAQEIKRDSIPLVDSIVAEDIGKLPDNTVADALQRVPGVQVARNNGEVTSVVIRGLPNLATTLNGNEIFTGTSRGVALQDIPAELVAGVDVYKSTTPDKLEGGIAGLIDVRLRRPLELPQRAMAASGRYIMGENAEKNGYVGSVLLSQRTKTADGGEVGALYSGSYQQRYFVDQTAFNFLFEPTGVPTNINSSGTLELPFTQGSLIIPGDRQRHAHNLSLQWRVNDKLEFYDNFLNTAYRDKHQVHFLIGFPRFGAFTAATINSGNVPLSTTSTNNFHLTSMQAFQQQTDGYQNILGAKWTAGDTRFVAEYLYNSNRFQNQALIVDTRFAPSGTATFKFTFNDGDGHANLGITSSEITDPARYYLWGLFDNHDESKSTQNGLKLQFDKPLSGFLQNLVGGLRWSSRDVRFRGTSRNDIAPAGATNGDRFAATVPTLASIPGSSGVNPDGPLSYYATPRWLTASPAFLYSQPDRVRSLFGLAAGPAPYNPTLGFTDTESVLAGYFDSKFRTKLGEKNLDGSIGFSVVRTQQKLQGYRTDGSAVNSDDSQVDILPVLNSRLRLTDELTLRLAAGRTMTRPNFSDLNPAVTLNAPTTTGGAAGSGSGGNPDLKTVRSDNLDLALEYYFAPASYVSVTGFYRSIDGYVQSFAARETINNVNYNVVRPRNGGKGHLDGFELSYQHFPKRLHGFGWVANFTYIEGSTDAPDSSPGAAVGARVRKPYAQVARESWNTILVYENKKFSARLAYNHRGEYTDTFDGPNAAGSALRQIIVKPTETLDASVSYNVTDHLTVSLDATNLLKTEYQDYFFDSNRYPRDTRAYDRTLEIGARYRF